MSTLDLRCPRCGARLSGRESWCLLCHADLRPRAEEPAPADRAAIDPLTAPVEVLLGAVEAEAVAAVAEGEPEPTAAPEPEPRRGGKHARRTAGAEAGGAPAGPGLADDVTDPEVMLALLRAESGDPLLDKAKVLRDPSTRLFVMVGGAMLVTGLLVVVLTLAGAVLG